MRWLDPDLDDEDWEDRLAAYSSHLDVIGPQLPAEVLALAREERFDLHDGRFVELDINVPAETVRIVVDASTPEGEWHRLSLLFEGASVVPDNLQRLGFAVRAEFRPTRWSRYRTTTIIHYQEVDIADDGRYVLRLRLWPFHEFAVLFRKLSSTDASIERPPNARAGNFHVIPSRDI